ncbi:hypothetical protein H7F10_15250 [Acidithiobacillus sp. HP-6]|uniref:glycosyltransferase n=1 Tax=unclassified Acidithiobacillus TaxID=2614800 RepID=UPI00187A563D|nr:MULTISPECIES: glycosyltransferase family 4 protein [unclassified Acidithiobacillus]MBE7564254.1 hypothetical protein [Acidithiobacillus sp. HP-6]MBE7570895.1 hypothetical protein [Acidithiobacillus sp. HP-2]
MQKLSILMTNIIMAERTGTEMATFELALALYQRGHRVMVYSPSLGRLAMELAARGIPVVDDISQIGIVPDIIHGNHNVALATAMIRFSKTPAVFVCHDVINPFDKPFRSPRITHYLAVDYACQERLLVSGIPKQQTEVVINAVNTDEYTLKPDISPKPRKALAIIKAFNLPFLKEAYIDTLAAASNSRNISLTLAGRGVGNEIENISSIIHDYDICFCFSRSAMETCCAGTHVIVTDEFGYGGVLDAELAKQWPDNHLSKHIALGPVTQVNLLHGIDLYQPRKIKEAAQAWRNLTSMDTLVERWESIYHNSIHNWKSLNAADHEDAELSHFISGFLPRATGELRSVAAIKQSVSPMMRMEHIDALTDLWQNDMPFSDNSLASTLILGEGWSYPEPSGVWSCDDTAQLKLPIKLLKNHGRIVELYCKHYFPATAPAEETAKVDVYLRDKQIIVLKFPHKNPGTSTEIWNKIEIPIEVLDSQDLLITLRLVICQPRSPALCKGGEDQRTLGIRLMALRLSQPKNTQLGMQNHG